MGTKKEQLKEKRKFQISCLFVFLLTAGCLGLLGIGMTCKGGEGKIEILSEKSSKTEKTGNQQKSAGTLAEQLKIPEHYKKEIKSKDNKAVLQIDADIVVPNVAGIGEKLVQPHTMTQERVDKIIKNIFPDGKLYDLENPEEKKEVSTKYGDKSQEEEMTYSDKNGSQKGVEQCTVKGWGYTKEQIPYNIYFYNYEKKEPSNMVWEEMSITREEKDDGKYIFNYDPENGTEKAADLKKKWEENHVEEQKISISQEEAYDIASEWLKKCEIQNVFCQKSLLVPETKSEIEETDTDKQQYTGEMAYYFEFGKEIENIPVLQENYMDDYYFSGDEEIEKTKNMPILLWPKEKVSIIVDENGLCTLSANGLSDSIGTEKEYVNLLTFEELEDICQKMLLNYLENNQELIETVKLEAKINRIELGYMRMLDKDEVEKGKLRGILKPVWCFYGSTNYQYGDSKFIASENDNDAILAISAETGGFIDPDIGDWNINETGI